MTLPQLLAAGTTAATVTVDVSRWHELVHTGADASNGADTNAVFLAFNGTAATATNAAGTNKLRLSASARELIPPGITSISYICAAGAPVFALKEMQIGILES